MNEQPLLLTDLEVLREELRIAKTSAVLRLLSAARRAQKISPNPSEWEKTLALCRAELHRRRRGSRGLR